MEALKKLLSQSSTLGEMIGEVKRWNADYVKVTFGGDDEKTTGAVVVLHGEDTEQYLQALDAVSDELDKESEFETPV